jgi:hypothetical protein
MSRNELQGKCSGIAVVVICFVMFASSLMGQTSETGALICHRSFSSSGAERDRHCHGRGLVPPLQRRSCNPQQSARR